jgi:acyl dehydratase
MQTDSAQTAEVGDTLPIFQRETGLHNWNRFAAVNDEFVPIHMDDEAGRAAGYPTAFGMGRLQWSYLHNMILPWLGPNGRLTRIGCQFRSPNIKGQTVTAKGVVTAIRRRRWARYRPGDMDRRPGRQQDGTRNGDCSARQLARFSQELATHQGEPAIGR